MKLCRASLLAALVGCAPDREDVLVFPAEPTSRDELHAVYRSSEAEYHWFVDGALQRRLNGTVVPADRTQRGQVWSVLVVDGEHQTTAEVTIGNLPPSASVAIEPRDPDAGQELTAIPLGHDPDGDELSYYISWTKNGQPTTFDQVVPGDEVAGGDEWTATVVPLDAEGAGEPASATVWVENSQPVITSLTISPAVLVAGSEPSAEWLGFDADGDELTAQVTWRLTGEPFIVGEPLAAGEVLEAELQISDGKGGSATATTSTIVSNTPPFASGVEVLPSAPTRSSLMTCEVRGWTDPDGSPVAGEVSWMVNGVLVEVSPVLSGEQVQRRDTVSCSFTPTDGTAVGPTLTSPSVEIGNAPPVISAVMFSPDPPRAGQEVEAIVEITDPDGDEVAVSYEWQSGGVFLSGDALVVAPSAGDELFVRVSATDFGLDASPVEDSRVVEPGPPIIERVGWVSLEPSLLHPPSVLVDAIDPEGGPLNVRFNWYVNGSLAVPFGVGGELPAGFALRGDEVVVEVVAEDQDGVRTQVLLEPVEIMNSEPTLGASTITPQPLTSADQPSCDTINGSDLDGDAVTVSVRWKIDGQAVSGPLLPGMATAGQSVECEVIASDGISESAPSFAAPVVLQDAAPSAPVPTIQPSDPQPGEPLACTFTPGEDLDGEPVVHDVVWQLDGVDFGPDAPQAGTTLGGEVWTCVVTASSSVVGPPGEASVTVAAATESNLVLVLLDDVGKDLLAAYEPHPDQPVLPTIDDLVSNGRRFDLAVGSPVGTPSRAMLLSGLQARRVGLGSNQAELPDTLDTLAERLPIDSAYVGKWGLSAPGDVDYFDRPVEQGFTEFAGTEANISDPTLWTRHVGAASTTSTEFPATVTVDDALALLPAEPFMMVVALHAPQSPYALPPAGLTTTPVLSSDSEALKHRANLEAIDTELGRLVAALPTDTLVVLTADNGTPADATLAPFDPLAAKGALAWGAEVPLIVAGPGVVPGVSPEPVSLADVAATLLATRNVEHSGLDGQTLWPLLVGASRDSWRSAVFSEQFGPSGLPPYTFDETSVRTADYVLAVEGGASQLYERSAAGPVAIDAGAMTEDELHAYNQLFSSLGEAWLGLSYGW